METILAPATTQGELEAATAPAVLFLESGQPVALPTETVYGLAADALNLDAVLKIFQTKERPLFDPLIVHLPTRTWLERIASIPADDRTLVEKLANQFWPGPLTLVLPRQPIVPDIVTAGLDTVAVRMSAHPVFDRIIRAFGKPLAAPSANRFGRISPTCTADVMEELSGRVPMVVDGGRTTHGIESTIVMIRNGAMILLRSGPVTPDELRRFGELTTSGPHAKMLAPGQLKSHYAPRTPLTLLAPDSEPHWTGPGKAGLLAWCSADCDGAFAAVEVLSKAGSLREAAATLFQKLRSLDNSGLARIVAESVPEQGIGIAIMDRLRKASANG